MRDKLLHTPEGVRDIYGSECEVKLVFQHNLHQILEHYGFHDIQTPSFEFFDIFNQERGTISSKDMYKLIDREGNTLVLRPDITPSVARCVAKYYREEELPIRLCYMGNTFINNVGYQGKLKEVTQLGAELVNDDSIEADAEMMALTIDCLLKSGLKEFQLVIGNAEFFRSIIEEAGYTDEEEINSLRILMENKNVFGVEEKVMSREMNEELRDLLLKLPELFGSIEVIHKAKNMTSNVRALKSIERLEQLYEILTEYGYDRYVSFDLAMLSEYNYYTGIIFKAYTYGTGEAVATGGRYDDLVGQFGKSAPAIGLVIVIDQLMLALGRQNLIPDREPSDTLIVYHKPYRKLAIQLAGDFRKDGLATVLQLSNGEESEDKFREYAKRMRIGGILFIDNDRNIRVMEVAAGTVKTAPLQNFMKL